MSGATPVAIAIITGVRALPLRGATPDGGWQGDENENVTPDELHCLIEVTTDIGIGGLGSAFTSGALVEGALRLLRPALIGQKVEPSRVAELLHQRTFWQGRGGSVCHAISGVDIALWDIFGKLCAQPVSRLLGGRYREKVKPYASLLMAAPPQMAANIKEAQERGFSAFKIGWGPFGRVSAAMDEAIVKEARETIGSDAELMVDAGGSDAFWEQAEKWARKTATMLEKYDVGWFEEPLRPDDIEGYAALQKVLVLLLVLPFVQLLLLLTLSLGLRRANRGLRGADAPRVVFAVDREARGRHPAARRDQGRRDF